MKKKLKFSELSFLKRVWIRIVFWMTPKPPGAPFEEFLRRAGIDK